MKIWDIIFSLLYSFDWKSQSVCLSCLIQLYMNIFPKKKTFCLYSKPMISKAMDNSESGWLQYNIVKWHLKSIIKY